MVLQCNKMLLFLFVIWYCTAKMLTVQPSGGDANAWERATLLRRQNRKISEVACHDCVYVVCSYAFHYYLQGCSLVLRLSMMPICKPVSIHILISPGSERFLTSTPFRNSATPGIFPCRINSALWLMIGSIIILATATTVSPFP